MPRGTEPAAIAVVVDIRPVIPEQVVIVEGVTNADAAAVEVEADLVVLVAAEYKLLSVLRW